MKQQQGHTHAAPIGPVLARFFSSGVLRELAHTGRSSVATRLYNQYSLFEAFDTEISVRKFYDAIFSRLTHEYRHEYIYKNAIAEKILLGRHNLRTAVMLTEFRADNCKADAVVLNGTSHVYEIKSEMDSFTRIDRQIEAYRKIFDFITVITTERLFQTVIERIPQEVGVMVLAEGKYQFKINECRREASSNKRNVNPVVIFNSLQRHEYTKIIEDYFGESLDHLPNTQIHQTAKKIFGELPPEIAHDCMVEALKTRKQKRGLTDFILTVPHSLKAASISVPLTTVERARLTDLLNRSASSVFM